VETNAETELELIGAIYDAVIDASLWVEAVDRIRRYLGFHMCMLSVIAVKSGKLLVSAQSNVPPPFSETAGLYGNAALDQWGGMKRISSFVSEEPYIHTEHNKPESWIGNPFYENWVKPQGLVDQLVIILEQNSSIIATVGLGVHESDPPIGEAQVEGLRRIAPHLRRAAIISGLLDGRAETASTFESTLDSLSLPVVLVGPDMRVVHANAAAQAMLRDGDPLANLGGRLQLRRELVDGQFEAAVRNATEDANGLMRGSGIPARRRDGGAVIAHVLPLQRRSSRPGNALAAVFVAEPSTTLDLPLEAIEALYGLRPAEGRVFEQIAAGLSEQQIADVLGVAPSTVKTHTLRLFDKLDVHSRAQVQQLARDMSLTPLAPRQGSRS
jgi:DNA-binding CsgD family transcriptional regulator